MKIPEEALPATGWPGFVVVGPRRIARSIEDRAVARKASSRTVKVVRVGRDEALVLPGGTPTWWIDRPWGGFLVRAHVEETITDYERGWKHVEAALGAVIRWRKIGNWLVADPMAFLVVMTSPGTNWSRRVPPIPASRYHLELGKTAIRAIEYDVIRFTREGESALAETARAEAAPLPSVPKPMARLARGLRQVSSHGGPLLVLDRDVALGWRGIFDADGHDVFTAGGACDYDAACSASGPMLRIGKAHALLLDTAAPTTWLADRNLILRSIDCEDFSTVVAGAYEIPETAWKRTRSKLTIGRGGARIMDATIRGDKPSTKRQSHGCYESLDVAIRAGAYAVDHCERDGEYLLANKRSTYAFEAFRLRRSR